MQQDSEQNIQILKNPVIFKEFLQKCFSWINQLFQFTKFILQKSECIKTEFALSDKYIKTKNTTVPATRNLIEFIWKFYDFPIKLALKGIQAIFDAGSKNWARKFCQDQLTPRLTRQNLPTYRMIFALANRGGGTRWGQLGHTPIKIWR